MKKERVRECVHHGFTLIELIVSVTILLVLAGLLVANYNSFANSQTAVQAAATLKDNLRAARTDAASGLKPAGCDTLVGYVVDFATTSSPPYYVMYAYCTVDGINQRIGSTKKLYQLPPGLTVTVSPAGSVLFYALDQGAAVSRTITIQGVNTSAKIAVSTSGSVEDVSP